MADQATAVTIQVNDTAVTITVDGDFYAKAAAKGGVKLWPEKQASEQGTAAPNPPQFWTFNFATPDEALKFAQDAQTLSSAAQTTLATPIAASEVK